MRSTIGTAACASAGALGSTASRAASPLACDVIRGYERLQAFGKKLAEIREDEVEFSARELVIHELTRRHRARLTLEGPPPRNVGRHRSFACGSLTPLRASRAGRTPDFTVASCSPSTRSASTSFSASSPARPVQQHALEASEEGRWAAEAPRQRRPTRHCPDDPGRTTCSKRPPKDPEDREGYEEEGRGGTDQCLR